MANIDVKFMKGNRNLAKQMGSKYVENKKGSNRRKSSKKK